MDRIAERGCAQPLTLGVVVLLATWVPARRAVRLDPVAALRSE